MQAITTKFLAPTNYRGSRIKATCERGSVIVPWDWQEDSEKNHALAACSLVKKFAEEDVKRHGSNDSNNPWLRPFVSGVLMGGGYAHVFQG
jgi:hypothetical protein